MNEPALVTQVVAPGFVAVSAAAEVPPGWIMRTMAGSKEIALANRGGQFYALDNSCSHAGGPLAHNKLSPDCTVECSWHNSVFEVTTGAVVSGPARKPVKTYPVQVVDGTVYVAI